MKTGDGRMRAPASEAEMAEAVAAATGPLAVRGGGTRGPAAPGEVLSTAALAGVTLHEPGALTLVARAGTPLEEVERTLAAEGQRLPFEPMDHRPLLGTGGVPTIGGVVAANVSGPRRIQAGACRDSLIGVRFVDGTGAVVKNGGRVMKNVTGYDLVKLMAGSRGTLGVLTEVAFKVLPAPEAAATLELTGLDPQEAVAALSAALGAPFEVSGAAHLTEAARSLVRIEGFEAQVAYRAERLAEVLAPWGAAAVARDPAAIGKTWAAVRDVTAFAGRPGDVWRISVRPSAGPAAHAALGAPPAVMDWGGGLIWALLPEGTDARADLAGIPGHATLVRASPATHARLGTLHPEPAPLARLAADLRARFDPRGLFAPSLAAA
jgi:glycolate oxidase FAD binding subunit